MEAVKELAIQFFQSAMEKANKALEFVPDDKLSWKPSPTAKSALEIAAHLGVVNASMADLIENRKSKFSTANDLFAWLQSEESKYTTRDSVQALLDKGAARTLKVINALNAKDLAEGTVESPFGTRPLRRFIFIPEGHTHEHAAQIEYLQTIWGDTEMH